MAQKPTKNSTQTAPTQSRRAILAQQVKVYREQAQAASARPVAAQTSTGKSTAAPRDEFLLAIPEGVSTPATQAYSELFDVLQTIRADPDIQAAVATEDARIAEARKLADEAVLRTNALYSEAAKRLTSGRFSVWEGKKETQAIDLANHLRTVIKDASADILAAGHEPVVGGEKVSAPSSEKGGKRVNIEAITLGYLQKVCEAASFNRATKVPEAPKNVDQAWLDANEHYQMAVAEIEANAAAGKQ